MGTGQNLAAEIRSQRYHPDQSRQGYGQDNPGYLSQESCLKQFPVAGLGGQFGQAFPAGEKGKTYTIAVFAKSLQGPAEVPLQIEQARRLGISAPFLGSDSWGSSDLVKLGGAQVEGCCFSTHYAPDRASPVARKFIAAFTAAYGSAPDDVAALTYDAFGLLFQALSRAGRADREALRDALAGTPSFEGVTGTMRFAPGSGDPVKSAVIIQVRQGAFAWFADAAP